MRIPVLSLLILIASPALGATQAYSEDCRPWFFDKVKSGLEEAGGVVGSRSDFPTGILVMPASGQIQKIVVRVWSVYECRLPKIVFYVEGDDIDAGTLRGVVTVAQAVFLEVAASEADMDDISSESLVKVVESCMDDRPRTYNKGTFRRDGFAYNRSVILHCMTEATVGGHPRTEFSFDLDPSTMKQQSAK
jgi:hypothetical protein